MHPEAPYQVDSVKSGARPETFAAGRPRRGYLSDIMADFYLCELVGSIYYADL